MAFDDGVLQIFGQAYTQSITASAQQMDSVFINACETSKEDNAAAKAVINRMLVAPKPTIQTVRYQPLVYAETDFVRRWVEPISAVASATLDLAEHQEKALGNIQSKIIASHIYSMKRQKDALFVSAFFGDVKEGNPKFTTEANVPFSTQNTIAVNFGSTANIGMTATKLDKALELLVASHAYMPGDTIYVAVSAKQVSDMRQSEELRNALYFKEETKTDAAGMIGSYNAFSFIQYQELPTGATSTIRRCPYWIKRGMHMADWTNMQTSVVPRHDVGLNVIGIKLFHTLNFARLDEVYCGEILCEEDPNA